MDNYEVMVTGNTDAGFTVVNTNVDILSIGVTKTWNGTKLAEVVVYLLANGERTGDRMVLNEANHWQHVFKNLPKTLNDEDINYSVEEEPLAGYDVTLTGSEEEGFVITNTEQPEDTDYYGDIAIRKDVVNPRTGDEDFIFRWHLQDATGTVSEREYNYELRNKDRTLAVGRISSGDTFTLKNGQELLIRYLPLGWSYTVEEIDARGYQVQTENATGVVGVDRVKVRFINSRGDTPPGTPPGTPPETPPGIPPDTPPSTPPDTPPSTPPDTPPGIPPDTPEKPDVPEPPVTTPPSKPEQPGGTKPPTPPGTVKPPPVGTPSQSPSQPQIKRAAPRTYDSGVGLYLALLGVAAAGIGSIEALRRRRP